MSKKEFIYKLPLTEKGIPRNISLNDLDDVRASLFKNVEDREEFENRYLSFINSLNIDDFRDRVFSERLFELGYLAAHITFSEDI